MFSLPLIRVAAASLLCGAVMILASTATAQAPVPPGAGNPPAAGQAGGKGIGPMVHALATSGVHGQQLAAAILGLQAAKGIAKGRVGLAGAGKQFPGGKVPFQGLPGGIPFGKGKGGQQAQLPIPGGQPPGPMPNQPGGHAGKVGGFPGKGKGQPGLQPQQPGPPGGGGNPALPGGQPGGPGGLPLGKGRGGKQGLLPVPGGPGGGGMPILPGGKQGPLGGFPKGRGKAGK